jgi:uncharacterized protein YjbI with pentapeptide repeats
LDALAAGAAPGGGKSVLAGIRLTGADIFWLAARAMAGAEGDATATLEVLAAASRGDSTALSTVHLGALHLQGVDLRDVNLSGAVLVGAHFDGAMLSRAHLEGSVLSYAHLNAALLNEAHLEGATLVRASATGTDFIDAHLEGANLSYADLQGASLARAELTGSTLHQAHLKGTDFTAASLVGADLRRALFDSSSVLQGTTIADKRDGIGPRVAEVKWNGADLRGIEWSTVRTLGDDHPERGKPGQSRIPAAYEAVTAYRGLSQALQAPELEEDAERFALKACVAQRRVYWLRHRYFAALLSWFSERLGGYQGDLRRVVVAYLLVNVVFTVAFHALASPSATPLSWFDAAVVSLTAFHGRGFLAENMKPGDPMSAVAAAEAVVGLVIEASFIAIFTKWFLGEQNRDGG